MLKLRLLGRFTALVDGKEVNGFRSVKSKVLLAYLAIKANPVKRADLISLLWDGYEQENAAASLRTALANLRAIVGDRIASDRDMVWLTGDIECDALDLLYTGRLATGIFLENCEGVDSQPFQVWRKSIEDRIGIALAPGGAITDVQIPIWPRTLPKLTLLCTLTTEPIQAVIEKLAEAELSRNML